MFARFGALLLVCAAVACSSTDETVQQPPPASTPAPAPNYSPTSTIAADLPPLNTNINNGTAPAETIRLAYEFAARHPEVLKYMPCFCGCEHLGHKGNDDCFVGGRDKNGKVTEWVTHGSICDVCIDVATQSMQMHNSGATLTEIRHAIDEQYKSRPSSMGTPMPPTKGKGH